MLPPHLLHEGGGPPPLLLPHGHPEGGLAPLQGQGVLPAQGGGGRGAQGVAGGGGLALGVWIRGAGSQGNG